MITLFVPIEDEYVSFNEKGTYKNHVMAINDIEIELPKVGINHHTNHHDILPEFSFFYVSLGCILVGMLPAKKPIFMVYIPENIDETANNLINNIIDTLDNNEFYLLQKNGKVWNHIKLNNSKRKSFVNS